MIKGTLELQSCSVAVTASSIVLTVSSVDGKTYTVTMPLGMGETLAQEIAVGTQTLRNVRDGVLAPAHADRQRSAAAHELAAFTRQIVRQSEEVCETAREYRAQLQEQRAQLQEQRAQFREHRAQFHAELERFCTVHQRSLAVANTSASS